MKTIVVILILLIPAFATAQTGIVSQQDLMLVRAEDARRYDSTLENLLTPRTNERVLIKAVISAGRIGDERAVARLSGLLREGSPRVREAAAFALGEIESGAGADALLQLLANASEAPATRARTVEALGKIAAANALHPKLAEMRRAILLTLEDEGKKTVNQHRETILLGLTAALRAAPRDAKRERPDDTDTIVARYLTHRDARIRADAANTLARVRAKNANDVLQRMVASDTDPIARANAARVLAAADDKTAVDILTKAATTDTDERVRVAAVRALATLRDPKPADALLARAELLFGVYKKTKKPGFIPSEQNEFMEIATALGRLLTNTRNERAVNMFREFGKLDRGFATEVYLARLRIAPGPGDGNDTPDLSHWRQYSSLAQLVGEFASLEPANDEGKRMKAEAPDILRPLAKAFAEANPVNDRDTIMAGPDVLRAYAQFKTADLSEILRAALRNEDVFIRGTAAELIAEQPVSEENLAVLNRELEAAMMADTQYNDAVLATLDALFKLDKIKALPALALASGSLDHLVRTKVADLLKDEALKNVELPAELKHANLERLRQVRQYSGKHTKLGQILNTDADYRRALARRNGAVRAVVTTQKGAFTIDLLPEDAPLTVDNFVKLARSGYYNGLEVHRVVPNFVMQDGDPRGDGNGGPGWSIRCELNMVPYERGVVGMALSGKDTGGSQWFVTHSPQPHLDGGYTVFGRVNETGMKVVDKIVRGDKIVSVRIVGQ